MIQKLSLLLLLIFHLGYGQEYDSVVFDKEPVDSNNKVYTVGSTFVFNYEIIYKGQKLKLNKNSGMFDSANFELVPNTSEDIKINTIELVVNAASESERTNKGQTQISYIQDPLSGSRHSTGLADNEHNIWLHPIRAGFFNALETAPFPYVKKPLEVGTEWTDQMKIGQPWGNEMWGTWDGSLLLSYHYKITEQDIIKSAIGHLECYVIESSATSDIGETKLKSYFSEKYGFVRMEYELLNDVKVNLWLIDHRSE